MYLQIYPLYKINFEFQFCLKVTLDCFHESTVFPNWHDLNPDICLCLRVNPRPINIHPTCLSPQTECLWDHVLLSQQALGDRTLLRKRWPYCSVHLNPALMSSQPTPAKALPKALCLWIDLNNKMGWKYYSQKINRLACSLVALIYLNHLPCGLYIPLCLSIFGFLCITEFFS